MVLTADQILSATRPEQLFKGDGHAVYRQLMKRWHPDRGADRATEVAAHINALYAKYNPEGKVLRVGVPAKGPLDFHFIERRSTDWGPMYIGTSTIVQVFDRADFAVYAEDVTSYFTYADNAMRDEHSRYLGKIAGRYFVDMHDAIAYHKPDGYFSIAQIMRKYPTMPPEHVAWILSSLYNVNAYLNYTRITYGGLTPETYFISPKQHNGILIGGWASSAPLGRKPFAIPAQLKGVGDPTDKSFDSGAIRLLGRTMLGADIHKAPMPMQLWLKRPGRADSYQEYKDWMQVLTDSFGKRRYIPLPFDETDL